MSRALPVRYCAACGHIGELNGKKSKCRSTHAVRYVDRSVAEYERTKLLAAKTKGKSK